MMRRKTRVCALQILYQMDVANEWDSLGSDLEASLQHACARYWASFEAVDNEAQAAALALVRGIVEVLPALDAALAAVSHHWKIGRMALVDRNILRLGAYEILYCPAIARSVSINEAIEMAKQFGGNDAGAFINGILDQLGERAAPTVSVTCAVPARGGSGQAAG